MTIAESLHETLEKKLATMLQEQGLTLHRQGCLYQVEDMDGIPVTELVMLPDILKGVIEWQKDRGS